MRVSVNFPTKHCIHMEDETFKKKIIIVKKKKKVVQIFQNLWSVGGGQQNYFYLFFRVWPHEAGRLYILGIGDDYGG